MKDPSKRPLFTAAFVRQALKGQTKLLTQDFDGERLIANVSTDSRSVGPDDLFVAIKGDVFDGHDFIAQAVGRGCKAVVCQRYPAEAVQIGIDIYLVEDTLKAYRSLASAWRRYLNPTVIAVAGSVGKTTTKDLLAALLKAKGANAVHHTKGSQNGFVGLPMTLLELKSDHQFAVIEVGIDAPGAMAQHIELVEPDIAIVTAISEEHLEWLKNLETIADEENLILKETARSDGLAVINLDDKWIKPLQQSLKSSRKIGFSLQVSASEDILSGKLSVDGDAMEVSGLGWPPTRVPLPLPGEHNARNLLGALAVAISLGLRPQDYPNGMSFFRPSGGRSQLEKSGTGADVLCDFYNANPASMRAAFDVAKRKVKSGGTLWLCLADMKELGDEEEKLHRGLAADIEELTTSVQAQVNVFLYGERMKWLRDELKIVNVEVDVEVFESHGELAAALKKLVKPNDFVLIKGSNSLKMEKVWEMIR